MQSFNLLKPVSNQRERRKRSSDRWTAWRSNAFLDMCSYKMEKDLSLIILEEFQKSVNFCKNFSLQNLRMHTNTRNGSILMKKWGLQETILQSTSCFCRPFICIKDPENEFTIDRLCTNWYSFAFSLISKIGYIYKF